MQPPWLRKPEAVHHLLVRPRLENQPILNLPIGDLVLDLQRVPQSVPVIAVFRRSSATNHLIDITHQERLRQKLSFDTVNHG